MFKKSVSRSQISTNLGARHTPQTTVILNAVKDLRLFVSYDGCAFPRSFITTPFQRSSTGRFEANPSKPVPGGRLPSWVQH
jgi:hypothetical protein